MAFQIARIVLVVGMLCVAAAIVTPRGRIPLALRGVAKLLTKDMGQKDVSTCVGVAFWRRLLAMLLVLLAVLLAAL